MIFQSSLSVFSTEVVIFTRYVENAWSRHLFLCMIRWYVFYNIIYLELEPKS